MGCYYCPREASVEYEEVGICKICYVLACGPPDNNHGSKCKTCGAFICKHDMSKHRNETSGHESLPLAKTFEDWSKAAAEKSFSLLSGKTPKDEKLAISQMTQLVQMLGNKELEVELAEFAQRKKVRFDTYPPSAVTENVGSRLKELLEAELFSQDISVE